MSSIPKQECCPALTWMGLFAALVASAGSLWLSLGMNLVPCPLCYYERTAAFACVGVLLIGLLSGADRGASTSLLALPVAALGMGVAAFHVWLEASGKLECPLGVGGFGSAPQQSLASLSLLALLLLADALGASRTGRASPLTVLASLIFAGVVTVASIYSVPPPPKPTKPYEDTPPKGCRPPYVTPASPV